jgi:hypothetical protein
MIGCEIVEVAVIDWYQRAAIPSTAMQQILIKETRVIVKIKPSNVSLDAIFKGENARDESTSPMR